MQYRHLTDKRRGVVVVYAAITLTLLIALAALTIDIGLKHDRLRHVQAAADASALSGAADMFKTWNTNHGAAGTAASVAQSIASANGYTNGSNGAVVTVNIPPSTGPNVGKAGYIEVIINKQDSRMFSRMYSSDNLVVQARAVARASFNAIGEGVIVLDLHDKSSLNAHGGGVMTLKGANMIVDSDNAQAGITNGSIGAQLRAPGFNITGNYTETGSSVFANPDGSTPANMTLGTPPMPDPLAYLPPPNPATMPAGVATSSPVPGGQGAKNWVLTPGVYSSNVTNFGAKDNVFMQPGIYYMNNGFSFSGQGTLTALGVMIYNNPGASNSNTISITGQGTVNMSPPDTGLYKGILIFQDRTASTTITVTGNGGFTIGGTFYAANALVSISGNGDAHIGSQYISRYLDLGGNGALTIDYTASPHPSRRVLQLVE